MKTPLERLTAMMQNTSVSFAQLLGMHPEIHLRYVNRQWECTQAAPEVWLGEPFLESRPIGPWNRFGDYIKLAATNGTWIWKLTGDTTTGTNIDGPFTMHRAVWPD